MSDAPELIIRKRNPGMLQSDDEIRQQFVVREHELGIVLETLRGNINADSCQHTLIVAPRGRGKTMLLARVSTELRTDPQLSSRLIPVRFMEESDEIFSIADFWLEVLLYLALAIHKQQPEFARNLRMARADLASRWRERELDERARAAVLEAAGRLGKRLVLMVENLQALRANVDRDFGWKLRKTLQMEPQIILVATATSRFEWLDDAQEPFFELFRTISLAPLDSAQCCRLWRVVSGEAAGERQIRPLEILTGGSPRFLVIVAAFTRHRSIRQLMEELVQLIDDLTDTFRGYLEALSKTERRVYLAVADLWQPSSTGEIAARARLDVRTVSTMLGRLVERGAVTYEGGGMKRAYSVAESLYRIYYKLCRERDEATVVHNLLHFMTAFYTTSAAPVRLEDSSAAIKTGDALLRRFGSSDQPDLREPIATALFHKGMEQTRIGHAEEALLTSDELDRRGQAIAGPSGDSFRWNARYVRMSARLSQGNREKAVDEFCSLYAGFHPEDQATIPRLVEAVALLVAADVPERQIIEVLSTEPNKIAAVAPLTIALRQRDGETVRAPTEVLKVAADVRRRIDEIGRSRSRPKAVDVSE